MMMMYEISYKCVNCGIKWNEVVSKELLEDVFGHKYEVMSRDWLYLLFKRGMEMHYCKLWMNKEPVEGTVSYGNVVSIRPIREKE